MANKNMATPGDALARGAKSATYRVPSNFDDGSGDKIVFHGTVAPEGEVELTDHVDNSALLFEKAQNERIAELAAFQEALVAEWMLVKQIKARPMGKKVLVWRIPEKKTLLELAETDTDKPVKCRVVSTNVNGLNQEDEVIIRNFSGTEVKLEGIILTVILAEDILLKL